MFRPIRGIVRDDHNQIEPKTHSRVKLIDAPHHKATIAAKHHHRAFGCAKPCANRFLQAQANRTEIHSRDKALRVRRRNAAPDLSHETPAIRDQDTILRQSLFQATQSMNVIHKAFGVLL